MGKYGEAKFHDEFTDRSGYSSNCNLSRHQECIGKLVHRTGKPCTCRCHKL